MVPPPLFTTHRRKKSPDVPQDVDELLDLHWNDPNYDINSLPSPIRSSGSLELEAQGITKDGYRSYDNDSSLDSPRYKDELDDYPSDSPYAEVRATVSNVDDPSMPCNTLRMWTIGIMVSIFVTAFNQTFSLRAPSVRISPILVQVLVLPVGRLLARILPTTRFSTFGYTWTLNPGPFNVKEHTVITAMALINQVGALATDVFLSQEVFYGQKFGYGYEIIVALSSQMMGYSLCGLLERFVVWPANMIWPGTLVTIAFLNTLHTKYSENERKKHMSREKFLLVVTLCSFLWYWVPGYLWTGLSFFNWVCWIAPENTTVNALFGYGNGLGMGIVTFDWAMVIYLSSPLVTPWWTEANILISFLFWHWFITPILYFTNTWYSEYMPIGSSGLFDNTGSPYNINAILTNGTFDVQKYQNYSPVFFPITYILTYGMAFAGTTAMVVHVYLWHRHDIIRQVRRIKTDERDIHSYLMRVYPEIPHGWYGFVFVANFILLVVAIVKYPTGLPFYAALLCLVLGAIFTPAIAIIYAITNQFCAINEILEVIIGYMVPGRPLANMLFKMYGTNMVSTATWFSGNLKLGHYMKVPPRIMFMAQMVATVIGCLVCVIVQRLLLDNVPGICTPMQKDRFICPTSTIFAQASVIFGDVGPSRLFGPSSLYNGILWFLLLGAVSPIPFYFLVRKYPTSIFRFVHTPVMWKTVENLNYANGVSFANWFIAGFIFQYWLRKYRTGWWVRYNYLLSGGLEFGIVCCSIFIFALTIPKGGIQLNWWGNTVYINTADYQGVPVKILAPGETFGPKTWS